MEPILVISYHRPYHFLRVLEAIKQQPHGQIFVYVDGPKSANDHACYEQQALATRLLLSGDVSKIFLENTNHGSGQSVPRAISWFFEKNLSGLIVEDDIVLSSKSLRVLEILVNNLRNYPSVKAINLRNTVPSRNLENWPKPVRLSKLMSSHGWWTTKSTWKQIKFRDELKNFSNIDNALHGKIGYIPAKVLVEILKKIRRDVRLTRATPWDVIVLFEFISRGWHTLNLNFNQVEYIGYGPDSEHHNKKPNSLISIAIDEIDLATISKLDYNLELDDIADRHRLHYEMKYTLPRYIVKATRNFLSKFLNKALIAR